MISDAELKALVSKVVHRTMHGEGALAEAPLPDGRALGGRKTIAVGADHGGFKMKEMLKAYLSAEGYEVVDCGTNSTQSVDYPDFALSVAEKVSRKEVCCGIIIDGAGIGSCMAANKVPGVRAAMCYNIATAINSREHNHANVLTLGAGFHGDNEAKLIVNTWLATKLGDGRHAKRVEKITAIEKKYSKVGK